MALLWFIILMLLILSEFCCFRDGGQRFSHTIISLRGSVSPTDLLLFGVCLSIDSRYYYYFFLCLGALVSNYGIITVAVIAFRQTKEKQIIGWKEMNIRV